MSYRDQLIHAFIEHYDALRRRAEGYVRSPQMAADIVQDCYLRIIQHDPAVRVENPLAFLHRVIGNLAIDLQRRAALQRRRTEPAPDSADQLVSAAPSAYQIIAGEQEYQLLRPAIEQLQLNAGLEAVTEPLLPLPLESQTELHTLPEAEASTAQKALLDIHLKKQSRPSTQ